MAQITIQQKHQISGALNRYTRRFASLTEAACTLTAIDPGTLARLKHGPEPTLSDQAWRRIAAQVGFYCGDWHAADTHAALFARAVFTDARYHCRIQGMVLPPGSGKTFTARNYIAGQPNAMYVAGSVAGSRRSLLAALCETAGITPQGDLSQMLRLFLEQLQSAHAPLLIVDDAHLLSARLLHLLTTVAAAASGSCGIVLMGTAGLLDKVHGLTPHSRLAAMMGNFFYVHKPSFYTDVALICQSNGISEQQVVAAVARQLQGNLHGIERTVRALSGSDMAA